MAWHILIVDDEAPIRRMLTTRFEEDGYKVVQAANGQAALQRLRQRFFDAAIVDIRMPRMSGIEFIGRAREIQPAMYVVVVTGRDDIRGEEYERLLVSTVDEFIRKPIDDIEGLSDRLSMAMLERAAQRSRTVSKTWLSAQILSKARDLSAFSFSGLFGARGRFLARHRQVDEDVYDTVLAAVREIASDLSLEGLLAPIIASGKFQQVLQENEDYREHFVHQFQVFLLGCWIIEKHLERIVKTCIDAYDLCRGHNALAHLQKAWFLTSIYHDVGYSFQKMENWIDQYFDTMLQLDRAPVHLELETILLRDHVELLLDKVAADICQGNLGRHFEALQMLKHATVVGRDHGLISALCLWRTARQRRDTRTGALKKIVDAAASAMALHNWKIWRNSTAIKGVPASQRPYPYSLEFHVDLAKHPLAFLLIYCDSVQEWGRPGVGYGSQDSENEIDTLQLVELEASDNSVLTRLSTIKGKEAPKDTAKVSRIFRNVATILRSEKLDFRIMVRRSRATKTYFVSESTKY